MAGKFEVYKDKAGEFRFRLKAGNGQTVLASEGYKSKASALSAVESVKKNAGDVSLYESTQTAGGKYRFKLLAKNKEAIGISESYDSAASRDNGIQAVGRAADGASVVDLTE